MSKVLVSRKCEILRKLGFLKKRCRNQGEIEWGASWTKKEGRSRESGPWSRSSQIFSFSSLSIFVSIVIWFPSNFNFLFLIFFVLKVSKLIQNKFNKLIICTINQILPILLGINKFFDFGLNWMHAILP